MTMPWHDGYAEERQRKLREQSARLEQEELKKKKNPRKKAKAIYGALRNNCCALEELIESGQLSEKALKRLDKAVTVMKVGFKIIKKVLKAEPRKATIRSTKATLTAAQSVALH